MALVNKKINEVNKEVSKNNKPVAKFQAGVVSASVWENAGDKDGKEFKFYTITFQRGFKNKKDEWENTTSMRVNDLPKLKLVLDKAFETLVLNNEEE
jgi:hypothetical protein